MQHQRAEGDHMQTDDGLGHLVTASDLGGVELTMKVGALILHVSLPTSTPC